MRYLIAISLGLMTSVGLFYFMSVLVRSGNNQDLNNSTSPIVEFVRVRKEQDTQVRKRELPQKPPPPEKPPEKPQLEVSDDQAIKTDDLQMSRPQLGDGLKGGIGPYLGRGGGGTGDAALLPVVRIEPRYPRKARTKGIEGKVTVEFIVSKTGSVKDVKLVEAKPPNVFNRAARRAVLKWKYKPQIQDGEAIEVRQSTTFEFKLQE